MPLVMHIITGLDIGGAERMLAQLAVRADRGRLSQVVVSMMGEGAIGRRLAGSGVTVETLGMRRGMPDPRGLARLFRILHRYRPDIVQTWLYHADFLGLVARQLGAAPRLLWNVRCSESVGAAWVRSVLARCSRMPDAVVVNSLVGQRYHQRLGYRPRRWAHIPNGFDTAVLRPDPKARRRLRAELRLDDDMLAIGMPARYHPMKDHATFLAAAALLARRRGDIRFLLIGEGIDASNRPLNAAIAAHGLADCVRLLGARADMACLYNALDVVTLSSAFGEGFPNVLGEAMACGVPCVATQSGDARALVGDAGLVVPPRDAAALAQAWERLSTLGPDERRALGKRGRERIMRDYELSVIVGRYEGLYDEILRG
ncbi:MAG TPA: glycosyltransferase [Stellaceae bacterium]|nr:glycosyltransferase [Stellaceae bacterium]